MKWNDYLELREDIAFNLVEGIDLGAMEARLKQEEGKNADIIAANQAKEVRKHDHGRAIFSCRPPLCLSLCLSCFVSSSSSDRQPNQMVVCSGFHFMQVEEEAERPRESAMDTREESPAEKVRDNLQRQKQLALLASGWSMELVRKRAVQEARDTFVIPAW